MRLRDVRQRLLFSVLVAVGGAYFVHGPGLAIWFVATVAAQFLSLLVSEPMRRDRNFRVSPERAIAFFGTLGLSATVFASAGALFWLQGGGEGRLVAVIVLTCGAMNVALQAGASAKLLWVGCAPFMAMLVGLPLVSLATSRGESRSVLLLTALAAAFCTLHLVAAGRRSLQAAREINRSLYEAKTERLRAVAASTVKSDFLGVMSHELRTPLNGVLGMAQIMETDELTPRQRDRLGVIRQSGEILLVLLNDLLDVSRIEAAELELDEAPVELQALLEQTQAVFGPLAAAKKLSFRMRLLKSAGAARLGDAMRVRQVLHNLVGNAIKFTESGRVTVVVSGAGDELIFDVIDTGPGIAPERVATLFERFGQDDLSASRRHGGSGLGLAIARGLARLMGGEVSVRSTRGDGSVFTARLRLPLAEAADSAAELPSPIGSLPQEAPEPAAVEAPAARFRVLAAEDNPTNQLVLTTLLHQVGIEVHVVGNGEEAVAAWRSAPWDLVLMDIHMPLVDGIAASRAIRAAEAAEGRPRTPILAVTANAMGHQATEYLAAGMDGLVPKPIQFAQLVAAITRAIDGDESKAGEPLADAFEDAAYPAA